MTLISILITKTSTNEYHEETNGPITFVVHANSVLPFYMFENEFIRLRQAER